jgi:hypothetical protein
LKAVEVVVDVEALGDYLSISMLKMASVLNAGAISLLKGITSRYLFTKIDIKYDKKYMKPSKNQMVYHLHYTC